jgi:hypothetical protein
VSAFNNGKVFRPDMPDEIGKRCTQIADAVVPEYRGGKRSYSCTGTVAKRWQAAWDGAAHALRGDLQPAHRSAHKKEKPSRG